MKPLSRGLLAAAAALLAACPAAAGGAGGADDAPVRIRVTPERVELSGPRAYRQLLVTGEYAGGRERDLTADAAFAPADPAVVAVEPHGLARARADGRTELVVTAAGASARVPVRVVRAAAADPVGFRHEVVAALNVAGCNAGACHGTPSGKNGFKLSLRGFDPAADYRTLTRDLSGRRVNRTDPDASLVLQKNLGVVPHEGGSRLQAGSVPARLLRDWIAGGLPDDRPGLPGVTRLEVLPGDRVLAGGARRQQLAVLARLADGSVRDVTRLTVFRSSDEGTARVSPEGLVEFARRGEVAVQARYLEEMASVRLTHVDPPAGFQWSGPTPLNFVDEHLFAKLRRLAIPASAPCDDAEFVRRLWLDVTGTLPAPERVARFLADTDPARRARLIDEALASPEHADYWALKWCDVLTVNRRAIQAKGAYLVRQWLREHVERNTPFDRVVREMLTASGSTFLNPPANFFRNDRKARPAEEISQNAAQVFLGIRLSCARCHNHPFERWTQDDYYGLAAFFARVKDRPDPLHPRVNRFNLGALDIYTAPSGEVAHPRTGKPAPARFPGGAVPEFRPGQDRREVLAAWVTSPENPFFARAAVNRAWYHVFGRGIVDPVDDFRDSNPPASDELLDALAKDFVAHGFDTRHLLRTVLNSRTYQLASVTVPLNEADERFFSHAVTKLLPAEVLLDALSSATESPEPFEGYRVGTRAVQLPDGDALHHPFLKAFGQPARETTCECERQADVGLGHALTLVNGPTLKGKLAAPGNRIGRLLASGQPDHAILRELYLATLSRPPSQAEASAALRHVASAGDRRAAWEDLQWALVNSKEFLFRH